MKIGEILVKGDKLLCESEPWDSLCDLSINLLESGRQTGNAGFYLVGTQLAALISQIRNIEVEAVEGRKGGENKKDE